MNEFRGRVAVVTGAASGIGLSLARVFAEQGMQVVLADIEEEPLQSALAEVEGLGVKAIARVCDVSNDADVEALADATLDTFGAVHVVCNNAGVFTGGQLWECSLDDFDWLVKVNQYGVINGIRNFIPRMIAGGEPGHMVNTASMAAVTSMPFSGIYNMTKHAVLCLSETLFHELSLSAPQIGVSCLCPEAFATGIAHSDRNRPVALKDAPDSDGRQLAMDSIVATTAGGKDPRIMAERVLQAIVEEQFYILSEDAWRETANARLEDIRSGNNPRLLPPEL
jgi:NAD(P)-dependent dehydrogenase (short-subunit alcohol dehydrogenase family)